MPLHARIPELAALAQVVLIDVVLAGDNAVVVGLAVAGLPSAQQRLAIVLGLAVATAIRVACAAAAFRLLEIIGLTLAGGLLLLWVCWRMYRELRRRPAAGVEAGLPRRTLGQAMLLIAFADLSMSLDNVLAVAGASEGHLWVLVVGLGLSVVLMGIAAGVLAKLLERYRWIAWIGVLIVFYVALKMIWEGTHQVAQAV
ncbi:MAG: YjbE family putative metal transport protein [Alphaproteobacteria bacterium]|nr:YjbE family putative metal transport protein [Alphaproteobacteria bacterium]